MATEIISKRCSKCKEIKSLSEFYKNIIAKDGYQYKCKVCHLKSVRECQQSEKGKTSNKHYHQSKKYKVYQKQYRQSEKGKVAIRKAVNKYQKTEKGKACHKHYNIQHPGYKQAKNAVNNAIRMGKLPRVYTLLCYYCPKPAQQYHHFLGYVPEHFFDIIPVCKECHKNHQLSFVV